MKNSPARRLPATARALQAVLRGHQPAEAIFAGLLSDMLSPLLPSTPVGARVVAGAKSKAQLPRRVKRVRPLPAEPPVELPAIPVADSHSPRIIDAEIVG